MNKNSSFKVLLLFQIFIFIGIVVAGIYMSYKGQEIVEAVREINLINNGDVNE